MEKYSESEKTFAQQVDEVLGQTRERYTGDLKVCDTPQILLDVGCRQLPMLYTQSHLRKAILPKNRKTHTHGLMVEQIKRLPELLSSPVMIMDSTSRNDSIVLVLSETDKEKDPIVATIRPNGIGIYDVDVINSNFITSVYGREDFPKFFEKSLQTDNVLYCNKEKAKKLFSVVGLEFPDGFNSVLDLDNIIRQSRNIVNTFDEKILPNEKGTKEMRQTNEKNFAFKTSEDGTLTITGFAKDVNVDEMENLVIPSEIDGRAVTSIGFKAFYCCINLMDVTIGSGVTSIGVEAFGNCPSLESIKIPDSVTSIGDSAFWGCDSLESVTIPDSVTSIGNSAFKACTSLTNIEIPDSVTRIEERAFSYCTSLESIEVDEDNEYYSSEDGVLFNKDKTELITCPGDKSGAYTISDSVTVISSYAFCGCPSLTSVEIPNSATNIGDCAFRGCTNLESIKIPDSVTSIGDCAFDGCPSLTSVTIPDSVTSIGFRAFEDCYSLENITIGSSVTSIGVEAFRDCDSLTIIEIPDSVTSIGEGAFENCKSLTSVTIPDSVTSIGKYAFDGCPSLTSITIPDSVTSIGGAAFAHCTSLMSIKVNENNEYYSSEDGVLFNKDKTELITCPGDKSGAYTISDSVTVISSYAFYGCPSLTSVEIPDSVTNIGDWAFHQCDSLTSVTIPDSVTSIGEGAFDGCPSLEKIIGTLGSKAERYAERYARKHSITFEAKAEPKARQQEKEQPPEKRNPWSIKTMFRNAKKISESYEQSKSTKTKEHKKSENEL